MRRIVNGAPKIPRPRRDREEAMENICSPPTVEQRKGVAGSLTPSIGRFSRCGRFASLLAPGTLKRLHFIIRSLLRL